MKPKHERRAQRYAAKARAIKDQARDRMHGDRLVEILCEHIPMTRRQRYQLHREMLRLIDGGITHVTVMSRLAIIGFPFWEDMHTGEFGMWLSARYQFIDGPDVHAQPAWRRVNRTKS